MSDSRDLQGARLNGAETPAASDTDLITVGAGPNYKERDLIDFLQIYKAVTIPKQHKGGG